MVGFEKALRAVKVIKEQIQYGMVGEVKMDWDGFICVVLYSSPMFCETFS